MREHTHKETRVALLSEQPATVDTLVLGRTPDGQPATPEDRTLLIRASVSADAFANASDDADSSGATPWVVVSAPAFKDGMFGEYVALERSIQDGLVRAADLGARSVTMGPITNETTNQWPADRAAYVLWNTIFRFLSERGDKPTPTEIQVLVERDDQAWSTALDKVVRTMLG